MKILKFDIPIDDQWHTIGVGTGVVHTGHQREGFVTVWFVQHDPERQNIETYRVYGTGQDIELYVGFTTYPKYVATVQAPGGLVWHLMVL